MNQLTLKEVMNRFSGNLVRFSLQGQHNEFYGRMMALVYDTYNLEVTIPAYLSFDVVDNMEQLRQGPFCKFKTLSIDEGQIENIEKINIW